MELTNLNQLYPNKCAFITGAGSGLGQAFAKVLSKNGWTLHLSDINKIGLEETKSQLKNADNTFLYKLNVTDEKQYKNVFNQAIINTKQIDLLINNAGVGDGQLFHKYEATNWKRVMDINVTGTFYGCHHFVPLMMAQKKGLIINVGSAAGFMNAPGMSAYNVSKAAVYSLSESLYHELKPHNVHVSVLTPTFFRTNITESMTSSDSFKGFVEKQMKYAKTNADEVAAVTLTKASKGKFQIIHPKDAKQSHFYKKWFPRKVNKIFEKMMARISNY